MHLDTTIYSNGLIVEWIGNHTTISLPDERSIDIRGGSTYFEPTRLCCKHGCPGTTKFANQVRKRKARLVVEEEADPPAAVPLSNGKDLLPITGEELLGQSGGNSWPRKRRGCPPAVAPCSVGVNY